MTVSVNQGLAKAGGMPRYTWAEALAAVTSFEGFCFITDVGINGSAWYSDGVNLTQVGEIIASHQNNTPVRIATFGDSTANLGATSSPDTQDMTFVTAPFPASGATSIGLTNMEKSALQMLYPQTYFICNAGISGDTTTGMLARDTAAASSTRKAVTDALNLKPDIVIFRGGSINDLTSVTASTWSATADTVYARHAKLLDMMLAGGVRVIDTGIYGYGDGSGATGSEPGAVRLALKKLNGLLAANAKTRIGKVYYLDPVDIVQASDGKFLSGLSNDGVHLNFTGQYLMSRLEANILTALFGTANSVRYPGVNLITNALLAATGSQSYGTVATGVSCSGTNATTGNAAIEHLYNQPYQTCEYTITSANSQMAVYMPCPVTTSNIVANDIFGFEYDFFIEGLNGFSPTITTFYGRVDIFKNGAGRVIDAMFAGAHGIWPDGGIHGKMIFPPFKIQENSAALTTSSVFNLVFGCSDAAGKVKIGVSNPRMVKLN